MRVRRLPILFPATPQRRRTEPPKIKPPKLTIREEQILVLICEGWSRREIAQMMDRSPNTIANHLKAVRNKTGCTKIAQLVIWAVVHNIVDPRKMLSS